MRIPFLTVGNSVSPQESRARNRRAEMIVRWIAVLRERSSISYTNELYPILSKGIVESVRSFLSSEDGSRLVDTVINLREDTPDEVLRSGDGLEWLWGRFNRQNLILQITPYLKTDLLDSELETWFRKVGNESSALGVLSANAQTLPRFNRTSLSRLGKMWTRKAADEEIEGLSEEAKVTMIAAFTELISLAEADPTIADAIEQRWNKIMGEPSFTLEEFSRVMTHVTEEFFESGKGARDLARALLTDSALTDKLINTPIKNRALLIARTEVGILQGESAKNHLLNNGFNARRWLTVGDQKVRQQHRDNEADGPLPWSEPFSDGSYDTGFRSVSPFRCRCDLVGVVLPGDDVPTVHSPEYEEV